jgi:hypothetical protein
MRQWGNGAIVAFACCCTLAGAQETIAPLASVCVSATAAGTPARGLAPADFLLLEDGEAREIVAATAGPPLRLVLLIDTSASVPFPANAAAQVRDAVGTSLTAVDRIAIGSAGPTTSIASFAAPDLRLLPRAVSQLVDQRTAYLGPSPLWDGINAAVSALEHLPGRRAIIVRTDGEATGNLMPYALVEQRAIAASVEVSFLMPPPAFDMRGGGVGNPLLPVATERPRQMAAATGGLLRRDAPLDPAWSMQADLRLLLNGLKGEYCLGFRASALDGKTHTLRVTSRRPGIVVRGPRAFVARR